MKQFYRKTKKVFCAVHKDHVDAKVMKEDDFIVPKKTFVHQNNIAPKWVKSSWQEAQDVSDLSVRIGALTVHKLGHLIPLSDSKGVLIPVGYECSRMFWSTKNPRIQIRYTCRIIEVCPDKMSDRSAQNSNVTTVHIEHASPLKEESTSVSSDDHCKITDTKDSKNDLKCPSSVKDNKVMAPLESGDIPVAVMEDVIKVVQRLIKKVLKKQKKYWEKVRNKISPMLDKSCDNGKNSFLGLSNSNINESKVLSNVLDSMQETSFNRQLGNDNSESRRQDSEIKKSNVNGVRSLSSLCSDAIKKSLLIASNNINNNNNEKKGEQSKYFYSEIFKKYIQSTRLKELKKKLKYLNKQQFEVSDKVIDLISDKEVAKEITDFILKRYNGVGDLPPKIVSLLDSILPPCSVNETVLPIFLAKENSGINESSGYSSNDDSHLRPPVLPQAVPLCVSKAKSRPHEEISLKDKNKLKKMEDSKSGTAWMKDIKLNGHKDFNHNIGVSSNRTSRPNTTHNRSNVEILEASANKMKNLNGISQNDGPFKCTKCKRLYRTNESFEKHCESCNFFVDSSSTEEESSDSSDGSEESSDSSSDENIRSELSKLPLKKPLHGPVGKNGSATRYVSKTKQILPKQPEICYNSRTSNEKQTKQTFTSVPRVQSNQNRANLLKSSLPSSSVPPQQSCYNNTKQTIQHPQKVNNVPCQQTLNSPNNIQYQTLLTSEGVVPNMPLSADTISNNFNIGFNNNICNTVPSGLVQLPCNTLLLPPGHETIQPSNPILHLPQNNFYNSPLELSANAQLSVLSGSLTITNNSFNMPDQVLPVFPQPSMNFGQPTILPSPLQMQQTGIQLSTLNVQQISLQGAFSSNSLNPFVFPQQTVNIPQNQVMFIEEPISHPLSSNSQSQNLVFQVPVGQLDNGFTFVAPQQFVNQVTFDSNVQNSQNVSHLHDQPKTLIIQEEANLQRSDSMPVLIPQVNANSINQRTLQNRIITSSVISPDLSYSPICASSTPSNSSCTTTPSVSSRSTPVPDSFHNSQSNIQSLTIPPDSPIMDFLKKAAEQVLSLSEKRKAPAQDLKADSGAPEKKTRFAHTRKVAARRAEKLRLQKGSVNVVSRTETNKPKTIQLNIATLKPSFPIPVVPVSSTESPIQGSLLPEAQPMEKSPDACERSRRNNSKVISYREESDEEDSILLRIQKHETKKSSENGEKNKPYIMYEISCEDGFTVQSHNIRDAWEKVYDTLQDSRVANYMKQIPVAPQDIDGLHMMGLDNTALIYLVEQLPGAESCKYYDFIFHKPTKEAEEVLENTTGCARSESYMGRRECDMFNFLASEYRDRPIFVPPEEEDEGAQKATRRSTNLDMPIALRFQNLKTVARETVGVYRSSIHGRGLFCKRNIDAGELVIEYAGEVIRSILTDKREKVYQSKGIGCYMFRIDDDEVVDATMHGNAARFINHSCEPNCFSKVITVDGKKHIVIFALRRISKGEELTYDYKFPFEEEKIPCHCNSRKCRKYLN